MNKITASPADGQIIKGILLMLICAVCLCSGQVIWKLMPGLHPLYLACGFGIYGIGAGAMTLAYRYGELSKLQPLNSLTYVFSQIIGALVFSEQMSPVKIAGVTAIVAGTVLIGSGGRR